MMGPILEFRDKYPPYLPPALILLPFLIIYFCLLVCLYPRYPRRGRVHFIIARNADPSLFQLPDGDEDELDRQQTLCAILSQILYWKTLMLHIAFYTCIVCVAAIALLMAYSRI